jgi:hypothetical protein
MEGSPSLEACCSSSGQDIRRLSRISRGSLQRSRLPPFYPIREAGKSSQQPHILLIYDNLQLSSHLQLGHPSNLFPSVFTAIFFLRFLSTCMLHVRSFRAP